MYLCRLLERQSHHRAGYRLRLEFLGTIACLAFDVKPVILISRDDEFTIWYDLVRCLGNGEQAILVNLMVPRLPVEIRDTPARHLRA